MEKLCAYWTVLFYFIEFNELVKSLPQSKHMVKGPIKPVDLLIHAANDLVAI